MCLVESGIVAIKAHGAWTRASTNRLGYAWWKRRQLDPGCGVDLLVAAWRFLREVHGEPVANLLAAGGEPSLEQRLRVVEGLVQNHETAILELERTQGQQLQFRDIAVEGTRTSIHPREQDFVSLEQFLYQCIRSSVSLAHLRMCEFGVLKFGSRYVYSALSGFVR